MPWRHIVFLSAVAEPTPTPISPLKGLLEVSRLVRADEELPDLLSAIARTVSESLGYESVVINIFRPAWNDFEVTTVHGSDEARTVLLGRVRTSVAARHNERRPESGRWRIGLAPGHDGAERRHHAGHLWRSPALLVHRRHQAWRHEW